MTLCNADGLLISPKTFELLRSEPECLRSAVRTYLDSCTLDLEKVLGGSTGSGIG